MEGAFTADFLFSVEKRLRLINERNYFRMLASENIWYPKLLRTVPLDGKSERFNWLIETASIDQLTPNDGGEAGGSVNYDELQEITVEYAPAYHARGYKIGKMKYLNKLNGGQDPVAKWVGAVSTYGAYYPQRLLSQVLLNAGNTVGYDGVNFFSTAHPVHPLIPGLGTYANDFTGSSSGSGATFYPGALPIDDSVTLDVAATNLSKALAYITGHISQPNGAGDPRFLEPLFLLHPPRMVSRVNQLLDADFIAQAASGGAGSADLRAFFRKYRITEPVEAKELDGGRSYTFPDPVTGLPVTVTGDDKTYYVVCKEASETELGAFLLNLRMPFTLHTYTGEGGSEGVDAVLGRSQDIEYLYDGWEAVNTGHPYTIFRFRGA
jgi:hypothetical protein